jgi:hypothetical protein
MIVCTNCGNHNEDTDEFCGSCGKFLEWVGERIEAPPAPVAEAEPEEDLDAKVGIIDRVKAAVGVESSGTALPSEPAGPTPEELELEAAAAAAAAEADADQQLRLEAEAAEAERRAALAEEEAQRRIQREAEAKRQAEEEAKARAEAEAQASAEAEERRHQELEAERKAAEEAASLAAAHAEAERAAEAARQAQVEAERAAATEAERQAAEAEAARQAQEAREAAEALEAAKRAEELARATAEAEAAARAEAEAKAKAEAEARQQAEEDAKRRAEDEARARIAAEQRAREEEEARKRAAALLARPKAPAPPVEEAKPADDPFVTPPAAAAASAPPRAAMTPAAAAAAAAQKPTAQTPAAQQPSTAKAPPRRDPKQTAAADTIKEGDLVCSQCGSGNDPTRKFCRKCGNSLAKAVPAKKLPWWKKLFGGKKVRTSKDAGAKDRRRKKSQDASFKTQMVMSNLKKVLLVAMMLGLVGGNFYFPSARGEITRRLSGGVRSVQDMFNPQVVAVNSLEPTATSAVPGKEARFAGDLVVNTFWAEAAEGDGVGETITFTFAEATDLTKVLLTVGSTDTTENYLNNPRPKKLHLVFDNGGSADLELEDEFRKAQGFNLKGAKGVTKVDIVISEVYPGRGGTETGIAEVEFKKKG